MLALGFGSEFSIMESVMSEKLDFLIFYQKLNILPIYSYFFKGTIIDVCKQFERLKNMFNTNLKIIIFRLIICSTYFLLALTMVTQVKFSERFFIKKMLKLDYFIF